MPRMTWLRPLMTRSGRFVPWTISPCDKSRELYPLTESCVSSRLYNRVFRTRLAPSKAAGWFGGL